MSPFIFPNPAIESKIIHPETKEIWEFIEGVWQVTGQDDDNHLHEQMGVNAASVSSLTTEVDQNEEQLQALSTTVLNLRNQVDDLSDLDLDSAIAALALAQQDIIELKSKVNALELTSFLILE